MSKKSVKDKFFDTVDLCDHYSQHCTVLLPALHCTQGPA